MSYSSRVVQIQHMPVENYNIQYVLVCEKK